MVFILLIKEEVDKFGKTCIDRTSQDIDVINVRSADEVGGANDELFME